MNVVELLFRDADPAAPALIEGATTLTYAALRDRVDAAAARFAHCPAPRIGLRCPSGIDYVVLALAIVRSGKCLIPLADELSAAERAEILRRTAVAAVVGPDGALEPLANPAAPAFDEAAFAALDPAFIRFSSGTTASSKGIVLSHETLLARARAANRGLGIGPGDRVVWILPMAHHFAASILLYLLHGAATVLVPSHLAADVLAAGRAHRGTVLYGAPFHHALLAAEPSGQTWPDLRLAVSTAAALPAATAEAFAARFGLPLTQGLGLIEVGLPLLNLAAARTKPTALGRPLPDFTAALRDGELHLRGPGLLDAYLDPWQPRAEILRDGWFATGDLAEQDADGDYFLLGRRHSVINVAGLKCFPEEIEAVLRAHPGVALARVTGRPHPKVGAVPVAEIIPRDPLSPPAVGDLVAHCRAALARYKIPLDFRFVETLPLTASGKLRRA